MSKNYSVSINVDKIDKTKLFEGKKGRYLDLVLIATEGNEYGNSHMAVQSVTKEEREAGKRGEILGNAKELGGERPKEQGWDEQQKEIAGGAKQAVTEDAPF